MDSDQSIDARIRSLIEAKIPARMRYIELEALTKINADTWKNFWFKRRKADGQMIERIARAHPEYAFWLATGATDVANGHQCPPTAECLEPQSTPLQTATTVLQKSVAAAQAVEKLYAKCPDDPDKASKVLHGFLNGNLMHAVPEPLIWPVDDAFKAIKALNLAIQLREEERKLSE